MKKFWPIRALLIPAASTMLCFSSLPGSISAAQAETGQVETAEELLQEGTSLWRVLCAIGWIMNRFDNSIHSRENIESFARQLLEDSLEKDEPWVTTREQAVEQTKQISKAVKMTCPGVH